MLGNELHETYATMQKDGWGRKSSSRLGALSIRDIQRILEDHDNVVAMAHDPFEADEVDQVEENF